MARFRNRFADCWLTNHRAVENMMVAFRIRTNGLSTGQRKSIEKMFRQGYGIGGRGDAEFIYEAYLKAAGPQQMISYGLNGIAFWFKDEAGTSKVPAVIEHLEAAAKLADAEKGVKAFKIERCMSDYDQAFIEPGYSYQGWRWHTPRLPPKLFAMSIYEYLERDSANDRGLAMFRANVPLIGKLLHSKSPSRTPGVPFDVIDHLKVTVADKEAARAALSQAGLAYQAKFIQG